MIFGEHEIGYGDGLHVGPPQLLMLRTSVMTVRMDGYDEIGNHEPVSAQLDRAEVERLRDLCEEALR